MSTITVTLTNYSGTVPDRDTQTQIQFDSAATTLMNYWVALAPELNSWSTEVNQVSSEVASNASAASDSAAAAAASAAAAEAAAVAVGASTGSTYAIGDAVTVSEDWDELEVSGVYRAPTGSTATGQPEGAYTDLIVEHTEGISGRAWQIARNTSNNDPTIWFRSKLASIWAEWQQVAKVAPGVVADRSNIYLDNTMSDESFYSGSDFSISVPQFGSAPDERASKNIVLADSTTGAVSINTGAFPVYPNTPYYFSATLGRITGVGSCTTRLSVNWYSDWEATTLISSDQVGDDVTGTLPLKRNATLTAPSDAVRASLTFEKDSSAGAIAAGLIDIDMVRAITDDLISSAVFQEPTTTATSVAASYVDGSGIGSILYQKSAANEIYPASLTKALTALVVSDLITQYSVSLSTSVTITNSDIVSASGDNVDVGDILSLEDALSNMLITSSNNTAQALSRVLGQVVVDDVGSGDAEDTFISKMNDKATALGMSGSTFLNPSGLYQSGQVTTAYDINKLMSEVTTDSLVYGKMQQLSDSISVTGPNARTMNITHTVDMMSDSDVLAAKSGTISPTDYHASFIVQAPKGNLMAVTILQSDNESERYVDARKVIDAVKVGADWPVTTAVLRT
jgi:D-alanyl-D-alanine carboxypeptidase